MFEQDKVPKVIYGIDNDGNPITRFRPDDSSPKNESIKGFETAFRANDIKFSDDLKMPQVISAETLSSELAQSLFYNESDLENAVSDYNRYKIASKFLEEESSFDIKDIRISFREFKSLLEAQYQQSNYNDKTEDGLSRSGRVQLSRLIAFTSGPYAGRTFVLYSSKPGVDLSTIDGLAKQISKLNQLQKVDLKSEDGKAILNNLMVRDGLGVLMLDYPRMTISETNDVLRNISSAGDNVLNQSMVSMNSKSKQHLLGAIVQIAKELRTRISPDETIKLAWNSETETTNGLDQLAEELDTEVLESDTLSSLVDNLYKEFKKGDPAAVNLVQAIAQITVDSNMGKLVIENHNSSDDEVNAAAMLGMNDKPLIAKSPSGAITFLSRTGFKQADGGSLKGIPFADINLAALLRLINGTAILAPIHNNSNLTDEDIKAIGDRSAAMLSNLIEQSATPGTIEKGFFVSPGLSTRVEWGTEWALVEESADLDKYLYTTAKGIDEPSAIFDLRLLAKAVDEAKNLDSAKALEIKKADEELDRLEETAKEAIKNAPTRERASVAAAKFIRLADSYNREGTTASIRDKIEKIKTVISTAADQAQLSINKSEAETPDIILKQLRDNIEFSIQMLDNLSDDQKRFIKKKLAEIAFLSWNKKAVKDNVGLINKYIEDNLDVKNLESADLFRAVVLNPLLSITDTQITDNMKWEDMMDAYDKTGLKVAGDGMTDAEIEEFLEKVSKATFSFDYDSEYSSPENSMKAGYLSSKSSRASVKGAWDPEWKKAAGIIKSLVMTNWNSSVVKDLEQFKKDNPEFSNSDSFKSALIQHKVNQRSGIATDAEIIPDVKSYIETINNSKISESHRRLQLETMQNALENVEMSDEIRNELTQMLGAELLDDSHTVYNFFLNSFDPRIHSAEFQNNVLTVLKQIEMSKDPVVQDLILRSRREIAIKKPTSQSINKLMVAYRNTLKATDPNFGKPEMNEFNALKNALLKILTNC